MNNFKFLIYIFVCRSLAFDKSIPWNSTGDCSRSGSLIKQQRLICERHVEMMTSLVQASQEVLDVCQELFADKRWNCSSALQAPNFSPDLTGGAVSELSLY